MHKVGGWICKTLSEAAADGNVIVLEWIRPLTIEASVLSKARYQCEWLPADESTMETTAVEKRSELVMLTRGVVCILVIIALSGCTANDNSIFRIWDVSGGKVALIDAKQRAILSNQGKGGNGENEEITRFCAEPSPDAFSVLSSAIGLSTSASNEDRLKAALQFSQSINESGASIGLRTQTITVLRDMMYRLCERYLNGAITASEFVTQAGRDQRLIVSVLAIEQLTGAVQPRTVVVGASSQASAGENIGAIQKVLDSAREELGNAEGELEKAKTALSDAKAAQATVEAVNPVADEQDTNGTMTVAEKNAALTQAAAVVEDAKKAVEKATTRVSERKMNVAAIKGQLANLRHIASSGRTVGLAVPATVGSGRDIGKVADAVKAIVQMNFDVDEVTLTCLRKLGANPEIPFCEEYLRRRAMEEKIRAFQALVDLGVKEPQLKQLIDDLKKTLLSK